MLGFGKIARPAAIVRRARAGRFTLIHADPGGSGPMAAMIALRREGVRACVAFGDPAGAPALAITRGPERSLTGWEGASAALHAAGEAGEPLGVITPSPADAALVAALLIAERGVPSARAIAEARSAFGVGVRADDAAKVASRAVPESGPGRALFRSLLGGMMGDALGAEVEFLDAEAAERRFGSRFRLIPHQGVMGAVTDDTQMSLFVAEGLIDAGPDAPEGAVSASVHAALLRWLDTQSGLPPRGGHGLCLDQRLRARRAPGLTCLSGLSSASGPDDRARNGSKGNGTIMRVAPIALWGPADRVGPLAERLSYQTHGHPTAAVASGAWAVLIRALADGARIREAAEMSKAWAAGRPDSAETISAFEAAMTLTPRGPAEHTAAFGNAGTAEVALAHALNACLRAGDACSAYEAAVVHGGDSDTVGSVAGNALGLMFPDEVAGSDWAAQVECLDLAAGVSRRW